jgi:hypothetical protein
MTTPSRTCHSEGCRIEVPEGFDDGDLFLDHYLQAATYTLDTAATRFREGQDVDSEMLHWLKIQVDFVVAAIGDEASSLNAVQRTRLLELVLGIANLNEYIRHDAFTIKHTY